MKNKIVIFAGVLFIIVIAIVIFSIIHFSNNANWKDKFEVSNLSTDTNMLGLKAEGTITNISSKDYWLDIIIVFSNGSNKVTEKQSTKLKSGETKDFWVLLSKDDVYNFEDYKPTLKQIKYSTD